MRDMFYITLILDGHAHHFVVCPAHFDRLHAMGIPFTNWYLVQTNDACPLCHDTRRRALS